MFNHIQTFWLLHNQIDGTMPHLIQNVIITGNENCEPPAALYMLVTVFLLFNSFIYSLLGYHKI